MSTSLTQEPFTRLEFAVGSIAMAIVVLIALLGPRFSQPLSQPLSQSQDAPPPASSNPATSARQWHRTPRGAAAEPSSQPSTGSGTIRALPPSDAVSAPGGPVAPSPRGTRAPSAFA